LLARRELSSLKGKLSFPRRELRVNRILQCFILEIKSGIFQVRHFSRTGSLFLNLFIAKASFFKVAILSSVNCASPTDLSSSGELSSPRGAEIHQGS
jgi:hypothetical protein